MRIIFRFSKDRRMRCYALRTVSETTSELWVEAGDGRRGRTQRRLAVFENDEHFEPFLAEVRRELEAGGWSEL